jgi:hypothetical protein
LSTDVRQFPRPPSPSQYAIAFAPDPQVTAWIEHELFGEHIALHIAPAIGFIASLIETLPPRPQILIVDFDALTPAQVEELRVVREAWFGTLIALGTVSDDLRASLHVDHVLARPLGSEALRKAVGSVGLERPTTRITRLT